MYCDFLTKNWVCSWCLHKIVLYYITSLQDPVLGYREGAHDAALSYGAALAGKTRSWTERSMGLLVLFELKIENLLTAFNNALAGKAQMKAKDHSSYRKSLL